jgi:hypothetical protein
VSADRTLTEAERAEALALLSRLRDGRPVDAAAAAWAHAVAGSDAETRAMLAAWERQAALLAQEPPLAAPAGFTDRVLAAARGEAAGEVLSLPVARRLALAAALLLTVTLGWSLARPAALRADPDLQKNHHAVDGFRRTPFAPDDIEAGLRAWLRDGQSRTTPEIVPSAGSRR